ncbi:MAG: hypothetical protein ACLUTU_00765 [Blautia faecis]
MGTISGYDLVWGELTWEEIAAILNVLIDKKSFTFHHKDPRIPGKWIDAEFYCSNYNMDAQTLEKNNEKWTGLSINIRREKEIMINVSDQLSKESKRKPGLLCNSKCYSCRWDKPSA